jgi:phosphosulfolactate synthase (CoM biosynthesis protein A)
MSPQSRREIIQEAIGAGLDVFTEVGRKFPTAPLTSPQLVEMIQADLESGARLVTIERSEIVQLMEKNSEVLVDTAKAVGFDKVIFESHLPGPDMMVWLIRTLGPQVNLMGHTEYCALAHDCRLGMNRSVGYSFLTAKGAKI